GALTALVVARVRGTPLRVRHKKEAWMRSICGTIAALGTFYTLAAPDLAVGDAATLFATAPIFVALLSWPMLGERVRGSVAFALAGILAVAQPSFKTAPHLVATGTFTAVASAVAMIWLRRMGPGESSEAIVFHFSSFGTVVAIVLSIPVWKTPDVRSALFLF